jgi:hypothetical protein
MHGGNRMHKWPAVGMCLVSSLLWFGSVAAAADASRGYDDPCSGAGIAAFASSIEEKCYIAEATAKETKPARQILKGHEPLRAGATIECKQNASVTITFCASRADVTIRGSDIGRYLVPNVPSKAGDTDEKTGPALRKAQLPAAGPERPSDDTIMWAADGIPVCKQSIGNLKIADTKRDWWTELQLAPPDSLIKAIVAKSGCFSLDSKEPNLADRTKQGGDTPSFELLPDVNVQLSRGQGSIGPLRGLGSFGLLASPYMTTEQVQLSLLESTLSALGTHSAVVPAATGKGGVGGSDTASDPISFLYLRDLLGLGLDRTYVDNPKGRQIAVAYMQAYEQTLRRFDALPGKTHSSKASFVSTVAEANHQCLTGARLEIRMQEDGSVVLWKSRANTESIASINLHAGDTAAALAILEDSLGQFSDLVTRQCMQKYLETIEDDIER